MLTVTMVPFEVPIHAILWCPQPSGPCFESPSIPIVQHLRLWGIFWISIPINAIYTYTVYSIYIYHFIRSHLFFPPKKQNPSASHFSRTSTKPFPFLKRERFSPSGGSRTATGRLSVFQSGETFELLSGLASLGAFGMKQSWNFPGDARWWQLKYVYFFREDSHFDWYI